MNKYKNNYLKILVLVILLCIVSFAVLVKFQKDMENREYDILRDELQEHAELDTIILERTLEGYVATLSGIAESVGDDPLQTDENMEYLKKILDSQAFVCLGISDMEGNLRVTDGNQTDIEINISDRSWFSEVISQGHYVITGIEESEITNERIFAVAVPIFDEEERMVGILHGAIGLEEFHPYEGVQMEGHKLQIQVIDKNGNYIVSSDDMQLSGDQSFFDELCMSKGDISAENILEMLRQGEPVVAECSYGGEDHIVCFKPLQLNSWYMVVSADKNNVTEDAASFWRTIVLPLVLIIACIIIFIFALILFVLKKNYHFRLEHEENRLKEKAEKDYLTGLYSRNSCVERVNELIREGVLSDDERKHAFVLLDLDNFKSVNDRLGHPVGDLALQEVANILSHHFREDDMVSRLAGDEFVVVLKNIPQNVVKKNISVLLRKLQMTFTEDSQSVDISASAGIAYIFDHGTTFEEIYKKADMALYLSKKRGKNVFTIYSDV